MVPRPEEGVLSPAGEEHESSAAQASRAMLHALVDVICRVTRDFTALGSDRRGPAALGAPRGLPGSELRDRAAPERVRPTWLDARHRVNPRQVVPSARRFPVAEMCAFTRRVLTTGRRHCCLVPLRPAGFRLQLCPVCPVVAADSGQGLWAVTERRPEPCATGAPAPLD
jgi:hypothetical protein